MKPLHLCPPLLTILIVVGLLASPAPAFGQSAPVRRPGDPPPASRRHQLDGRSPQGPFEATLICNTPQVPPAQSAVSVPHEPVRSFVVLVEEELYSHTEIQQAVATYMDDIRLEGFSVLLASVENPSPWGIRNLLVSLYEQLPNLEGCFLVGDFPSFNLFVRHIGPFPDYTFHRCTLAYMDMDAQWIDSDNDGYIDGPTAGSGDEGPEIYCGRINSDNMTLQPGQTEVSLLVRYFEKVHDYRLGRAITNGRACLYVDDYRMEHLDTYSHEMGLVWPGFDCFSDRYQTTAPHFLGRIQIPYVWLRLYDYREYAGFGFTTPAGMSGRSWVNPSDIVANPPQVLFYELNCWLAGSFPDPDCIALWCLLTGKGLGALTTAEWSVAEDLSAFYAAIDYEHSVGHAFMNWFDSMAPYDSAEREDNFSMLWLGDPTLSLRSLLHGTLWCNSTTGEVRVRLADCRSSYDGASTGTIDFAAGWKLEGTGDLDGDGRDDVLWRNSSTGQVTGWIIRGLAVDSTGSIGTVDPASGWAIQGVGDFNNDGRDDLLWHETRTGLVATWLMNGLVFKGAGVIGTVDPALGWAIRGVGDFAGDGKADVLWRNTTTGDVAIWQLNGIRLNGGSIVGRVDPALGWTIQGTGDFNGDGKCDILWRNVNTGEVAVWLMNGARLVRGAVVATVDPALGWTIQGTGDFDKDGRHDIAWLNASTGEFAVWRMRGASCLGGAVVYTVDPASGWSVQGIGNFR